MNLLMKMKQRKEKIVYNIKHNLCHHFDYWIKCVDLIYLFEKDKLC